ncbi:hypothetical protein L9H26_19075 [Morganella psychrotolerans]|uniref:Uncharacterized protein n=1 Tax=Morganella psychrotolerans TaxID=368603 RepID=A0A5M9R0K2_9GAMM|nr:hypothetical protein [Morganella psychrotolerans]KAA8713005.1 hypothetical protein F4V73_17975 [Morganella psychrotolerans]
MNVEVNNSLRLTVTDVARHDPILVNLDDYGSGRGRVTVTEFSDSWTASWGAMGGSLVDFLTRVDNDYLIGCLAPGLHPVVDDTSSEAALRFVKNEILTRRREGVLSGALARQMRTDAERSSDLRSDCCDYWSGSCLSQLFCDAPHAVDWPVVTNPLYSRMESRLNAVRKALESIPTELLTPLVKTSPDAVRNEFESEYAIEAGLVVAHIGYRYESIETEKAFKAWCHAKKYCHHLPK